MVTQRTFQFEEEGSIPISPHLLRIRPGKFREFSELLEKYHYKHSKIGGSISHNLVLEFEDRVYGGAVLGPMRHQNSYEDDAIEIRRMVLHPDCPQNTASYFLAKIIWWLRKNTDVGMIYTFSDQTVGHVGTCYRAANFQYVRDTPPTKHVRWQDKLYHPRSLTVDRPYSYRLRKAVEEGDAEIINGKPKSLFAYEIKRNK